MASHGATRGGDYVPQVTDSRVQGLGFTNGGVSPREMFEQPRANAHVDAPHAVGVATSGAWCL